MSLNIQKLFLFVINHNKVKNYMVNLDYPSCKHGRFIKQLLSLVLIYIITVIESVNKASELLISTWICKSRCIKLPTLCEGNLQKLSKSDILERLFIISDVQKPRELSSITFLQLWKDFRVYLHLRAYIIRDRELLGIDDGSYIFIS